MTTAPLTQGSYSLAAAPGALPVLGHVLPLLRNPLDFLTSLPSRGDLIELRFGPRRAYLAAHPELALHVLLEARTFDKGGPLFEKTRVLIGNGLVATDFDTHKHQRRLVQPAFHPARIPGYAALMRQEIAAELATWQAGQTIDINEAMHALTLRVTARTLFSTEVGAQVVPEVAHCMPVIMRGVYKRMVAPTGLMELLPTKEKHRYYDAHARMHRIITETVADHRGAGTDQGDLLSILINEHDPHTGERLSDQEIHDQVLTLLIGGTETTGNAMAWALRVLSEHPDIEARLHEEVDHVLGGRMPGFEDVHALDYTRRILNETLRMYPPAWLLTRTVTRDVELAGRLLKPGTIVMYSPYLLGRDPNSYADPERFDPDRWLPRRADEVPRGAMLPFGAGNRKCVGDQFGVTEITLTLAAIASRWRLRRAPGAKAGTAVPRASLGTGPLRMVPEPRGAASG